MRKLLLLLPFLIHASGCSESETQVEKPALQQNPLAYEINLNQGWQFQKTQGKSKQAEPLATPWQQVQVPHTPKIEPMVVNDQWQGISFYKKELDLSQIGPSKQVYLRFEGAMKVADVWLDGTYLGQHLGGYLPFTFDVTPFIGKKAELLVRLDNQDNYMIGPKPLHLLDFNTYGGLYRDVRLLVKNKLHITDEMEVAQPASGGIFITTPVVSKELAQVQVKTHIENSNSDAVDFEVKQTLLFDNQPVGTISDSYTLAAGESQQFGQGLEVKSPQLWHPNHPNLYQVKTEVLSQGEVVDSQTTRIGIRQFSFNDKHELLINGELFFLRGVNRHQEYPHVGYATSPEADYRDAYKIKSAGFDYVRLSHYPHSKAFMEAADELGLVLIDAILGWQYYSPFPEFEEQIYQTCHDLIRRDRNHASVLAWECSLNESWMPPHFLNGLDEIVEQEYPGAFSAGWQKGYDIYLQARQHRLEHYETPNQPYNVSEYGDWEYYAQNAGLNQDAWGDLKAEERTSRQLLSSGEKRLLQQATNIQEAHNDNLKVPAHADGYWVMYDYNRGYSDDLEASGIASIYRLPKYSYYFYQSQRSPELKSEAYESGPMVYIASDWTAESNTQVRVYTNTDKVELYLNDKLVATQTPKQKGIASELAHPPVYFDLAKFEAGELVAKAYLDSKLVAEHKVVTPQAPAAIELTLDVSGKEPAAKDVVFVYAQVQDKAGNPVWDSGIEVDFKLSGDIQLLNPEAITTERGVATAVVKLGENFSGATIEAKGKSLELAAGTLKL